jgi:Protein kinase domain
VVRIT